MAEPGFWDNQEAAQATIAELKALGAILKPLDEAIAAADDLQALVEMADEDDVARRPKLPAELERLEALVGELELKALLSGPYDAKGAILTINARDGGTDANDWAEMLLRMYIHWAQKNDYAVEMLDRQDNERGRHQKRGDGDSRADGLRLSEGRDRHAPPGADQPVQRRRQAADQLRRRRRLARGHRHGRDRNARRGHSRGRVSRQRRRRAARQQDLERDPPDALADGHRRAVPERAQPAQEPGHGDQDAAGPAGAAGRRKTRSRAGRQVSRKAKTGFGSQIRNYFLHPDQRVKDARTGYYVGNFQSVLDGNIQGFLDAYLRWRSRTESSAAAPSPSCER